MTNSSEIANELSWKCPKDHLHQALVGGRAHKSAIYPEEDGGSVGIAYGMVWDDLTGANLDPREVSKARLKELGYINDKSVFKKIPRK